MIVLVMRGTKRKLTTSVRLKAEDELALKVQIGMTLVSGLFTILAVVLAGLFGR
jgi:hypothetical protein